MEQKIVIAPRQSGKTLSCLSIFLDDPINTLWIVTNNKLKDRITKLVNAYDDKVQKTLDKYFDNIVFVNSPINNSNHKKIITDEFFYHEQAIDFRTLLENSNLESVYFTGTPIKSIDQNCFNFIKLKRKQIPSIQVSDKLVDEFCQYQNLDPSRIGKNNKQYINKQFNYLSGSLITDPNTELFFLNYVFKKNTYDKLEKTIPEDLFRISYLNRIFSDRTRKLKK